MRRLLIACALALAPTAASAQPVDALDGIAKAEQDDASGLDEQSLTDEELAAEYKAFADQVLAGVEPEQGNVALPGAPVTVSVSPAFDFYDAAESRVILENLWGNPPDDTVEGMVFPAGVSPADSEWGAVFTYEETGYVSDDDAASTDYGALLADMQKSTTEGNAALKAEGYPEVTLAGWAVPPTYNAEGHTLIWAKDLIFSTSEGAHTLNYDMRLLGRHGVLSINLIGPIEALPELSGIGPDVIAMANFDSGASYADYVEGDKTAGYGVAALIAGGAGAAVLKKAGLLAVVLAFLKKGIFLVPIVFVAAWQFIRRMFNGGAKS